MHLYWPPTWHAIEAAVDFNWLMDSPAQVLSAFPHLMLLVLLMPARLG